MKIVNLTNALIWSYCGTIASSALVGAAVISKCKISMIGPTILLSANVFMFLQNLKKILN